MNTCVKIALASPLQTIAIAAAIVFASVWATVLAQEFFFASVIREEAGDFLEKDSELYRLIMVASRPATPEQLQNALAIMPARESADKVALRAWIDAKDRAVWPPLEAHLRGEKDFTPTSEDTARLKIAAEAVNEGVARLERPLVPMFELDIGRAQDADKLSPQERTRRALTGLLARTGADAASQLATVSLLRDFGLTIPVESMDNLTRQAKRTGRVELFLEAIRDPSLRTLWQSEFKGADTEDAILGKVADIPSRANWFASKNNRGISEQESASIARSILALRKLEAMWIRLHHLNRATQILQGMLLIVVLLGISARISKTLRGAFSADRQKMFAASLIWGAASGAIGGLAGVVIEHARTTMLYDAPNWFTARGVEQASYALVGLALGAIVTAIGAFHAMRSQPGRTTNT